MKKRIFKNASKVLAGILVAASIAGCSGTGSTTTPSSSPTKTPASTPKATATSQPVPTSSTPMDISVTGIDWGYGPSQNSLMEQYWEEQFNVNFDIDWVSYQDYDQKINAMIAANDLTDVIQIKVTGGSFYYPVFVQSIKANNFVNMEPYLFNNGNGIAETNPVLSNWDESFWKQAYFDGGIYIIPRSKAKVAANSGIYVRKDLMEKYGFTNEPTTIDELKQWLIDFSNAATAGEGKKYYALEYATDNFLDAKAKAFAVAFTGQEEWGIDKNGDFQYICFNEGYIDCLNYWKDLYDAGVIDQEFTLKNGNTTNWKNGNSVALLSAWDSWNQSADRTTQRIFKEGLVDDTAQAWCLLPVEGPKAPAIALNATDIDSCIAISAKCSEEKILKILDIFNATDDKYENYTNVLLFGVEGVHYYFDETGTRQKTDDMKKESTAGYVGAWNQIFLKADMDFVEQKFERAGSSRSSDESIARAREIQSRLLNIVETRPEIQFANRNLSSPTYNLEWANLISDVQSNSCRVVMGEMTIDEWKKFVDTLVKSPDYKAIQKEFKTAYEAAN